MKFSSIETERLIIRPLKTSDAEHIFETWTSDPRVTKFMTYSTNKSVEDTKQWLERVEAEEDSETVLDAGFQLKKTGALIGSGGAYYRPQHDRWEIGYNFAFDCWHKGYATEAARAIVNYLNKEKGIKHFIACHALENTGSGRVIEKVGMKFDHNGVYNCYDKRVFDAKYYILDLD